MWGKKMSKGRGEKIGMMEEKCGEVSRIEGHLRDGILRWRLPKKYKAIHMNSQNNEADRVPSGHLLSPN